MKLTSIYLISILLIAMHSLAADVDTTLTRFDYDFGKTTSPVKSGWTAITPETTGDIYWSAKPSAADRGGLDGASDITRDFVYSRNTITLSHKIANGEWELSLNMGDLGVNSDSKRDNMQVVAEGKTLADDVDTEPGEIKTVTGTVSVTDGELNIILSDNGGTNPYWTLNRLTISKAPLPGTTGTLHHPNGEILRAAPMTWNKSYPRPVAYAKNRNSWYAFKDFHYNAIRLTWVGARKSSNPDLDVWTWPELLSELDSVVATAVATNMCLVINYHYVGEQGSQNPNGPDLEMNFLEEFWTQVAPRYKDNELVIYELQNEPSFSKTTMTSAEYKAGFLRVYRKVRELAPERQIIVFSSPHHHYIDDLLTSYENDLDWDFTVGGYHLYNGGVSTSIQEAAKRHRVVCTEWDYSVEQHSYVSPVDGDAEGSQTLERLGQGWMDWSTHQGPIFSHSLLIPDAIAKGYQWWENSGTTITWDAPTSDSLFFEGENIPVKISLTDDGSIDYCNLFIDGYLIGKDSHAPFEWNDDALKAMKPGDYIARIEAVDNEGHVETSTRKFSVLPGKASKIQILNPSEDAFVRNNGTQDGTGTRLLSQHAHNSSNGRKAFLKFDLSEIDKSSVGAAKLRVYNTGDAEDGFITLHELLNDNWSENEITYTNAPKNTGIPGRVGVGRGGEAAPEIAFTHKNEWLEFDVTAFINQELKDDKTVTFEYSNKYECQERFVHSHETDLLFSFASRESNKAPQLILANVGASDTLKVSDVALSNSNLVLVEGESFKLQANLIPLAVANKKVSWLSGNTGVATVDQYGNVAALAVGNTVVTATTSDGSFTAQCGIKVLDENTKLSAKPVAYWDFDETTGGTANDKIGNAHGIWQNGSSTNLSWGTGKIGGAAQLSGGDNDKFIVASDPLAGCTQFTISGWLNMNASGQYIGLLTTRDLDNGGKNWGLAAEGTHIDARWNGSAVDGISQVVLGKWHHVAITWKNTGEREFYFDGKLDTKNTSDVTAYSAASKWWFGDDPCCGGRELKGYIDDFAMFNKALSAEEIALVYTRGENNKALSSLTDVNTGFLSFQNNSDLGLRIFPNPVKQSLTISLNVTNQQEIELLIYSQSGQILRSACFENVNPTSFSEQIELSDFSNGVYYLKMIAGNTSEVKKFVVQN